MRVDATYRILRRLLAIGRARRSLVLQSLLLLGSARFLLSILPLRKVRSLIPWIALWLMPGPRNASGEEIIWALEIVTRRFSGTCLTNALAALALLNRHGHTGTLRIGAARKDGHFSAHAWVERDGEIVIGGPATVVQQFTPLRALNDGRI